MAIFLRHAKHAACQAGWRAKLLILLSAYGRRHAERSGPLEGCLELSPDRWTQLLLAGGSVPRAAAAAGLGLYGLAKGHSMRCQRSGRIRGGHGFQYYLLGSRIRVAGLVGGARAGDLDNMEAGMFGNLAYPSFVFWPVGNGDSTTVAMPDDITLQIDINDCSMAENSDNERMPVVDELVGKLPRRNGKPYLSCFALTHPDLDHVRGFEDLLKRVVIGELWFTPRIFWEFKKDLSDDAKAFCEEAQRRVKRTIAAKGDPGAGHRVRVIGYDELLQEDNYKGLPKQFLTIPGHTITTIDGTNVSAFFSAFVHAPFKDDSAGERNETSLALQIELIDGGMVGRGLFLGDLAYPTIRRIFDETRRHGNMHRLLWDVYLAAHHCSKKVMYQPDENGNDVLKQDILDELEEAQAAGGDIVASSSEFPAANKPGDNPPHILARRRYEAIVDDEFLCTAEYSTPENMRPIVFSLTNNGLELVDDALADAEASSLAAAVAAARGADAPPAKKVGFGDAE
jgi:hypothetical protein